jgi:hypothetical protein
MKYSLLTFASLLIAVSVLAAESQSDKQTEAQKKGGASVNLTFDQLKDACRNPSSFHNQNAPSNIQISCRNLTYKWIPDPDGAMTMAIPRHVTSSIYSDKYVVGSVTEPVGTPNQNVSCPRFKQVSQSVETVLAVTCDQILAAKGNLTDYCTAALDNMTKSNPASIVQQDTERTIDTCTLQSKPEEQIQQ